MFYYRHKLSPRLGLQLHLPYLMPVFHQNLYGMNQLVMSSCHLCLLSPSPFPVLSQYMLKTKPSTIKKQLTHSHLIYIYIYMHTHSAAPPYSSVLGSHCLGCVCKWSTDRYRRSICSYVPNGNKCMGN